ncbi:Uncharacterised protein [Salmonella enterica subsp. arizonae]|uniref:Uncharacterized protein n=1 Tax=Salmonella enterica subsp. arizonae TaxID=59203 RepID=A0A379S782_SALER|nr:Uncharacterised protein [Salmonella enterica subsp. arizonae]
MSSKIFGMLNREDHDELLFTLLSKSRAQLVDNGEFLDSWDAVNTNFTAANIADVYLVALECLKLSILPVTAGLKKNIGLDTAATMQGAMRQLFNALLKTLTEPSVQNSVIWRVIESGLIRYQRCNVRPRLFRFHYESFRRYPV